MSKKPEKPMPVYEDVYNSFRKLPGPTQILLAAEKFYLRAGGWKQHRSGLWWNPMYKGFFHRSYAVQVSKSRDGNVGLTDGYLIPLLTLKLDVVPPKKKRERHLRVVKD